MSKRKSNEKVKQSLHDFNKAIMSDIKRELSDDHDFFNWLYPPERVNEPLIHGVVSLTANQLKGER